MKFQIKEEINAVESWQDSNKVSWLYINEKTGNEIGIDIEDILGDVGLIEEQNGDILENDSNQLEVGKFRVYLSKKERILGYIPVISEDGKEGYLRIIAKKNKSLIVPLLIAFIVVLLCGIASAVYFKNNSFLDKNSVSYQMPGGQVNANPEEIIIPIVTTVTVDSNTGEAHAGLANIEGNPCYFKFSIVLNETGETIYTSKWVKPGDAILDFKLDKELVIGDYPITVKVDSGSLDNPDIPLNGGEVDSTLVVR